MILPHQEREEQARQRSERRERRARALPTTPDRPTHARQPGAPEQQRNEARAIDITDRIPNMPTTTGATPSDYEQRRKALGKVMEGRTCTLAPAKDGKRGRARSANEIMKTCVTLENEDAELGIVPTVLRQVDFRTAWDTAIRDLGDRAPDTKRLITYVMRKVITGDNIEAQFEMFTRHKGPEDAAEEIVKYLSKVYFGDTSLREATLLGRRSQIRSENGRRRRWHPLEAPVSNRGYL